MYMVIAGGVSIFLADSSSSSRSKEGRWGADMDICYIIGE